MYAAPRITPKLAITATKKLSLKPPLKSKLAYKPLVQVTRAARVIHE